MQLFLAPMDGVVDWVMRDLLTEIGGIDRCITEFIRVTDTLYPPHVFYKRCPELLSGGTTRSGVPVYVQLLGGKPEPMATNALRACELGAGGIDLNFGCPAKTVNNNDGGAALLKSANRIYDIVNAVRKAVPAQIPVSAKIRLGYDHPNDAATIAKAAEEAGASLLTVHCRTKMDGYKPPAYWEWIPKIRTQVSIPIVVNGEIWSIDDFKRCQEQTNENIFMIGRGALQDPFLFLKIKGLNKTDNDWTSMRTLLPEFYKRSVEHQNDNFAVTRTKQWLKSLSTKNIDANIVYQKTKTLTQPTEFQSQLTNLCLVK